MNEETVILPAVFIMNSLLFKLLSSIERNENTIPQLDWLVATPQPKIVPNPGKIVSGTLTTEGVFVYKRSLFNVQIIIQCTNRNMHYPEWKPTIATVYCSCTDSDFPQESLPEFSTEYIYRTGGFIET